MMRDDLSSPRLPTPTRLAVDAYAWDTLCARCHETLGEHSEWDCQDSLGEYDGPLVLRGPAPGPDLVAVNAALVDALEGLLAWAESGAVETVLARSHAPDCGCAEPIEAARAALALARMQS